jgi:hypothetical protein
MFGVDRKPLTDRQADAFDPEQTYCFASDTVRIRNYQLRSAAMLRGCRARFARFSSKISFLEI